MSELPLPLTPEQIAAFSAGQTVVHAEDPATKQRYVLINEAPPRLTVAELRAMLQEGVDQIDRGEGVEWDAERIKEHLRRRLAERRES